MATDSLEIQETLDSLEDVFKSRVIINTNLSIVDFVEEYFLPKALEIKESGLFDEDDENEITNMINSISLEKAPVKDLVGSNSQEYSSKATVLQGRVDKNLRVLRKKFNMVKVEISRKLMTSTAVLGKEIEQDDVPLLGFEKYIPGPGGLYQIEKPPDGWTVTKMKLNDWLTKVNTTVEDKTLSTYLFGKDSPDILLFKSGVEYSFIPSSGSAKIEGRLTPTGMENLLATEFLVFPLSRYPPPYFVEHNFEHNFYMFLQGFMLVGGLDRVREGTNKEGKRYILAEISQHFEDVMIAGRTDTSINQMLKVYGFEGVIEDYVLFMSYPVFPEGDNHDIEASLKKMLSHIHTFRPVKLPHSEYVTLTAQYKRIANDQFSAYLSENGKQFFFQQLFFTFARMLKLNIQTPSDRVRMVNLLRPFQEYGNQVGVTDEDWMDVAGIGWNPFWDMFNHSSSEGGSDFFTLLSGILDQAKRDIRNGGSAVGQGS